MAASICLIQQPQTGCDHAKTRAERRLHGRCGKNISCDLHQEHLNREVKNAFGGLSSNKSVKRVGKSIKGLSTIAHAFESLPHPSRKPKTKDVKMMVEQLRKTEAFRFHKHFKNFASNPC